MAERKTYTAEDFKGMRGREVLVRGRITSDVPDRNGDLRFFVPYRMNTEPGQCSQAIAPSAIVEILPEEIKVGDKVRAADGGTARLLCIHGDEAWLGFPDGCGTFNLSDLTLVERAG